MKLSSLDFTTPNNACHSLRVIAEWVRTGEVSLTSDPCPGDMQPGKQKVFLLIEPGKAAEARS